MSEIIVLNNRLSGHLEFFKTLDFSTRNQDLDSRHLILIFKYEVRCIFYKPIILHPIFPE